MSLNMLNVVLKKTVIHSTFDDGLNHQLITVKIERNIIQTSFTYAY